MSSTTATASSQSSPSRKRPISSSTALSPPLPSAKRHGLSSTSKSRRSANKHGHELLLKKSTDQQERQSRSRRLDNKSPSSESSRSSSCSNQSASRELLSRPLDQSTVGSHHTNESAAGKRPYWNPMNNSKPKSEIQTDMIYTKKSTPLAVIVKPSTKTDPRTPARTCGRDNDYEQTKQLSNKVLAKSTSTLVPSPVIAVVKPTAVLSKKSLRTDKVIIQPVDGTINTNPPAKLVKLVVPHTKSSSSSIKMLSSNDGLASALRIPTKIQLTKAPFVSSVKSEKTPTSLISSAASQQDQPILSPSLAASLLDTPTDATDNQPSIGDYHASAALPPTPPPPVIDHTNSTVRNILSHASTASLEEQKHHLHNIATTNRKATEDTDSSTSDEHSNRSNAPKRHSLTLSDWSVPPTSELSPASLTSSSPDLTQNHVPADGPLNEHDPSSQVKDLTTRRRSWSTSCPVLPSFTTSYLQSTETTCLKPTKAKSLTRLSNSSQRKRMTKNDRLASTSPVLQLSSSQRAKRRRQNGNVVRNQYSEKIYKSKTKQLKLQPNNDPMIIEDLLAEIVERVVVANNDNALKSLLNTSTSRSNQTAPANRLSNRQTNVLRGPSANKKRNSTLQSIGSIAPNESRSMIMTPKEVDDLAYLLHANAHRVDYERIADPAKVDERMREMWSQMSDQQKSTYYKRVLQIYIRPRRDTALTAHSSAIEKRPFPSADSTDNTHSPSLLTNTLSLDLKRQTSTPLSFHSVPSSTADDQSIISPSESTFRTNISADIVNELIKGAKGLDKLSCSPTVFTDSIEAFARATMSKQTEIVNDLEQRIEKKCSTQLNRATVFWTQKIHYFATKYQINSSNESMNELTLIVKYFYLLVLSLNCQKRETAFQQAITSLLHGNLAFIDPLFCSSALTSIIEDLILCSSLANDYLASQPLLIDNVEHSLPFVRNCELETELLNANEPNLLSNPFADFQDLQDYLNHCENPPMNIPYYPPQQSHHPPMYYPVYHSSSQYYYPPSQVSEMKNYYYNAPSTYPHSPQVFPYAQSTPYYHPAAPYANNNSNEQFQYYYNPQHPPYTYPSQSNSTNDIPLPTNASLHRSYRPMSSTTKRTYSNSQQSAISSANSRASAVFDAPTVASSQSPSQSAE